MVNCNLSLCVSARARTVHLSQQMELEYIWEGWVKATKPLYAVSFVQAFYINNDLSAIINCMSIWKIQ